jgi:acetyl esterase
VFERIADPELEAWLRDQPEYSEPDLVAWRADIEERAALRPRDVEMERVADLDAAGVPVRLYVPSGEPAALLVYLHGGGWTIGSLEGHDALCRAIGDGAGVRILSVGYRLAPEHPWPAAVDDAVAVLRWVAIGPSQLGGTPTRSGVAGDSSGGALAALACQRLRDRDPVALPDVQILLCPNTDLDADTPSMREKAVGFGLDAELVRWFARQWVPDPERWTDPRVSPLRAEDLSGLPRALVVTAEHDPLRDEGEAYARRLAEAGVTTTLRRDLGVVHNPIMLARVSPACADALRRVIADVRTLLGG